MSDGFSFKKLTLVVVGGSVVVAGGLIGGSAMLRSPAISLKNDTKTTQTYSQERTITVKGVAEKEIVADRASMQIAIYYNATDQQNGIADGYKRIKADQEKAMVILRKLGISEKDVENVQIDYNQVNRDITITQDKKTITKSEFQYYRFCCSFRIVSSDVQAVSKASTELCDLIASGLEISIGAPQFFVSNLEQYKLELIDSATASAYQRAETLATKSGAQLGPLRLARQGVIQITRPASNDTSDYGVYDTTSIKKVMRLVVTLEFTLKK